MTELYAYDFDKTLIPYDSFKRYIMQLLKRHPMRIGWICLLRCLRILNNADFKCRIVSLVQHSNQENALAQQFMQTIAKDIVWPDNIPADAHLLVITASPMCYMQYLPQYISRQCDVLASTFQDDAFVHLYGSQKMQALQSNYPTTLYTYCFAMSDSSSDVAWMKEFEQYQLLNTK